MRHGRRRRGPLDPVVDVLREGVHGIERIGSRHLDSRAPHDEEVERRQRIRRARRRANRRLGFLTHLGCYLATLAMLLVATRSIRLVVVVGLGWGVGVFIHHLWAIAAPGLRERWVEDEVGTRSARGVATERRAVETRSRRSLEDLSASIAHEIRNPITAAKSLVQQMGEDPSSRENLEYADLALSELDRVERSISHLLRYARDEQPQLEALDLWKVVRSAAEGQRERAGSQGIELIVDVEGSGAMRGDAEKLRRVIENLVGNAIEALSAAAIGSPRIEIAGGESLAGDTVWLRVIDNGTGIGSEERDRIWSPFYTTREQGTGLGLALCRKTVEAHGGRIELVSGSGSGSVFELSFPRGPSARDAMTSEDER